MRSKTYLASLSSQIDSAFTNDILSAYRQLDTLDSLITTDNDPMLLNAFNSKTSVSEKVIDYFRQHKNEPQLDYNFDRIFWIDSSGQQKIKGQAGREVTLFNNVSARNYFKLIKDKKAYMLPRYDSLFFGLEPINSWADGEFRIIISKESRSKAWSSCSAGNKNAFSYINDFTAGLWLCYH